MHKEIIQDKSFI